LFHRRSCHGCNGGGCYGGGCSGYYGSCAGSYGGGYGCTGGGYGGCYGGGYGCAGGGYAGGGYGCAGGGYIGGGYGCPGGAGGVIITPAAPAAAPGKAPEAAPKPKTDGKASVAAPATIIVSLPADATLTIDGAATRSTSATRVFASPVLEPGKEYFYTLKADLVQEDKTMSTTKKVFVRAGDETPVTLDFSEPTLAQR
jgi:uncharacterized protein (TIGR03000 family)